MSVLQARTGLAELCAEFCSEVSHAAAVLSGTLGLDRLAVQSREGNRRNERGEVGHGGGFFADTA